MNEYATVWCSTLLAEELACVPLCAPTTSQGERIAPITPKQPILLNSDPHRCVVMKTKDF